MFVNQIIKIGWLYVEMLRVVVGGGLGDPRGKDLVMLGKLRAILRLTLVCRELCHSIIDNWTQTSFVVAYLTK